MKYILFCQIFYLLQTSLKCEHKMKKAKILYLPFKDFKVIKDLERRYDFHPLEDCPEFTPKDVQFLLYFRNSENKYKFSVDNYEQLKLSPYDPNKETKFLIHGWFEDGVYFGKKFAKEYLKSKDINLISVEWSKYSRCEYFHIVENIIDPLSAVVSVVIKHLLNDGSSSDKFHIIGYSLGAQIAGITGKYVAPDKLGRITDAMNTIGCGAQGKITDDCTLGSKQQFAISDSFLKTKQCFGYGRTKRNNRKKVKYVADEMTSKIRTKLKEVETYEILNCFAGVRSQRMGYKIARVTGLDPAMPGYSVTDDKRRIGPNDAKIVDIIHTNAFNIGIGEPRGTIDFWPNGGHHQPNCESDDCICMHHMAVRFFLKSINEPEAFPAFHCEQPIESGYCKYDTNNIAYMGENVTKTAKGDYILKTH